MKLEAKEKKQFITTLLQQRMEMQEYYEEHFLEETLEAFRQKVCGHQEDHPESYCYDFLITTVGFDITSSLLWIRALQPKQVFFICSAETKPLINKIGEKAGLSFTQVEYVEVEGADGKDVYEKVKEYIHKKKLGSKDMHRIGIDITGGKKSMVTSASLAANHLGIDILYVDNNGHFPGEKNLSPGKETPSILEDPLEVFGDRFSMMGISKFNSEDFESAAELFRSIQDRVNNPRKYEAYEALAKGYQALECMEFKKAAEHIDRALELAERVETSEIPVRKLRKQLRAIEPLKEMEKKTEEQLLREEEIFWPLLGYLFTMAEHYLNRKKHDIAAMLTYRCLEMFIQRGLIQHGIYVNKPKFDHLDQEQLMVRFNEIGAEVFFNFVPVSIHELTGHVSLMKGLILLRSLEEPSIDQLNLQNIQEYIVLRNKSRLVHGFDILAPDKVKAFYYTVRELFHQAWKDASGDITENVSFKEFSHQFSFLNIDVPHYELPVK